MKKNPGGFFHAGFMLDGTVFNMVQVLYEDNHLIAVYKPAGVLVQADETGDRCLMDEVKKYLREKYNKPCEAFLGMIHRLDRPVSGIVLFAKTSKGASRLAEQFRNHTVSKIYHALVAGRPPKEKGALAHFLKKDKEKNITSSYKNQVQGSLRAELNYEIVREGEKATLLKINLKTGRPHQIRAQLSAIGCSIIGDVKYGGPKWDKPNEIALCATELSFNLAAKDARKTIKINIPENLYKFVDLRN